MAGPISRAGTAVLGMASALAVVSGCSSADASGSAPGIAVTTSATASAPQAASGTVPPATTTSGSARRTTTPGHSQAAGSGGVQAGRAAPQVARPLNASHVAQTPCAAMDRDALAAMGFTSGGATAGTQCQWQGHGGASVRIVWQTVAVAGLSDVYAQKSTMYYFQPTTVRGYPAVYASAFSDRRADGECSLYTAVDNSTVFATDYTAAPSNARHACQLASQAAAAVIQHLGGQ
jgi:hypothetical protein